MDCIHRYIDTVHRPQKILKPIEKREKKNELFKKLWGSQKQKTPANENAYTAFWQWFQQHQQHFHHIVNQGSKTEIERDFFN